MRTQRLSVEAEGPHAGMAPREEWEQTQVHKASKYFCSKCGARFASPHEVYDHLDAEHSKPKTPRRKR